ncbi:MAG: 4'-phosphopantetheinyl transferase superfamily protein [Bacteroidaceae bacterium]|nr:4'-phosphopantetheinyl transferase superfamily protein [Bacteroidaceae bacterium]
MLYIRTDIETITTAELQDALAALPDWRRDQALKFKFPLGQKECAFSYLLLCDGLQKEYGITQPLHFQLGEHGKPTLLEYPDIHFNISHCKAGIAVAISSEPVGVDIECIGRGNDSLARHVLSDEEYAQMQEAPDPSIAFAQFWTRKEALVKLTGQGITDNLKKLLSECNHVEIVTEIHAEKEFVLSVAKYCQN